MSVTVATVAKDVRRLIDDQNMADLAVSVDRLQELIGREAQIVGAAVGLNNDWVANAVTLVVNISDYQLPTTVQYWQVVGLWRNRDGVELSHLPLEIVQALREGTTAPQGEPQAFAMWEDYSGTTRRVTIRLDANPTSTEAGKTLNLMRSPLPQRIGAGLIDVTVNLPFSALGVAALAYRVAAHCAAMMSPQQREARQIGLEAVPGWRESAASAMEDERIRIYRLKHSGRFQPVVMR